MVQKFRTYYTRPIGYFSKQHTFILHCSHDYLLDQIPTTIFYCLKTIKVENHQFKFHAFIIAQYLIHGTKLGNEGLN